MVVTLSPSTWTASIRQERADLPFTSTVQAPQTPCSQPTCVPVSISSWRRKSASVVRTLTSRWNAIPFTSTLTFRDSSMGLFQRTQHHGVRNTFPVPGVDVCVVHGLQPVAGLRDLVEQRRRGLSALEPYIRALRSAVQTADHHRGARDPSMLHLQQHCRRGYREITMPAGKLLKSKAVATAP